MAIELVKLERKASWESVDNGCSVCASYTGNKHYTSTAYSNPKKRIWQLKKGSTESVLPIGKGESPLALELRRSGGLRKRPVEESSI